MYDIIINPVAGSGETLRQFPRIEECLKQRGLEYRVHTTGAAKDATLLAEQAAKDGSDGVIVMGGDGTLSESAAGLKNTGVPLLIASCGTGNDYIKTLQLPKDPVEALKLQLDRNIRQFDMCRINDRTFINVAGTGLDVDVLRHTDKYKARYKGLGAYLRGLKDALKNYAPYTAELSIDGSGFVTTSFGVLSLGLGRYIGGGIKAVPMGDPADGKLDLIILKPVKKAVALPCVVLFALGLHVRFGITQVCRKVDRFAIRAKGMTVQIDGELIPCDVAEFEILKGALTLRV